LAYIGRAPAKVKGSFIFETSAFSYSSFYLNLFLTNRTSMVLHNNFADFVLFLYVHMAHSDSDYHSAEIEVIRDKMAKIFPKEINHEQKLQDAVAQYKSLTKANIYAVIEGSFKHFDKVKFSQKYKVYTDMYDIINADGVIDESETKALEELKKIIDINSSATAA
jgi:uncharacterized tellurite resistance protein B-like protein